MLGWQGGQCSRKLSQDTSREQPGCWHRRWSLRLAFPMVLPTPVLLVKRNAWDSGMQQLFDVEKSTGLRTVLATDKATSLSRVTQESDTRQQPLALNSLSDGK